MDGEGLCCLKESAANEDVERMWKKPNVHRSKRLTLLFVILGISVLTRYQSTHTFSGKNS